MKKPTEVVDDAVQRIVDEVHPLSIVMFGSAARGDVGPNSDLDLLVIMPDGVDRRETTYRIYRRLRGLGCATDIIVVLESDVIALRGNPNLIIHTALSEGKELFRAA